MKLLFLRSQLVDVEVGFRDWADIGDVELGFDRRLGDRSGSGGPGFRIAACQASW